MRIYYGASDDSCRAIYQQIKETLQNNRILCKRRHTSRRQEWDGLEESRGGEGAVAAARGVLTFSRSSARLR